MTTKTGATLVAACALLSACATQPNPNEEARNIPTAVGADGEGWHCYGAPSPFYNPGWVFSVDRAGVRLDEIDLRPELAPSQFPAGAGANTVFTNNSKWNLGMAASVLKLKGVANVNAQAGAGQLYNVSVSVSDRTDETSFGSIKDAAQAWANRSTTTIDTSRKYYVVRKAIAAKTYHYKIDTALGAALGGSATLPKFDAEVGGTMSCGATAADNATPIKDCVASAGNSGVFEIKQTFNNPLRVCIVAEQLNIRRGSGLEGTGFIVEPAAATPAIPLFNTSASKR